MAAIILVGDIVAVVSVVRTAARLRSELRQTVGLRAEIDEAVHNLQTHEPSHPAISLALGRLDAVAAAVRQTDLAPEAEPTSLAVAALRAGLAGEGSGEGLTGARQAVFLRSKELSGKLRARAGQISGGLDGDWQRMEGLAIASIGLAGLVLIFVLLEQRQAQARGALARQLELALSQAEAARREAQTANRAKSEFLATVSHELRTPLTSVVGTVDLLGNTTLDGHQRDYLAVIAAGSDAVLRLVSDVLDFSRIEAGRLEIDARTTVLEPILDELALLFAGPAEQKGLELSVTVGGDVPASIRTDPDRLRQILVNLVGNAVKFTAYGEIAVRVSRRVGTLAFAVRDTGPGIADGLRDRLFAPFEQGVPARVVGGSGLGLAISRRLATALGGEVHVHSEPGAGATFVLEVPIAEPTPPPPCSPAQLFALVGDDPGTQAAGEQLRNWGWSRAPASAAALTIYGRGVLPHEPSGRWLALRPLSTPPGKGLEVRGPIRPGALRAALGEGPPASVPSEPPDRPLRILVVDDQATNRKVLSEMLSKLGHLVQVAGSGEDAVDVARAEAFDLILMDVDMPGLDGLSATQILREEGGLSRDTAIVGLSGHATEDARHAGLRAGMDAWVSKPVRLDDLRVATRVRHT